MKKYEISDALIGKILTVSLDNKHLLNFHIIKDFKVSDTTLTAFWHSFDEPFKLKNPWGKSLNTCNETGTPAFTNLCENSIVSSRHISMVDENRNVLGNFANVSCEVKIGDNKGSFDCIAQLSNSSS